MPAHGLTITTLPDIPLVRPGDDLGAMLIDAIERGGTGLADFDVVVVAQKIVSRSEGRYVDLATVTPSARARELAAETEKDARLVELILAESAEVLRYRPGVLVVVHRTGMVMANAGIDRSNVESEGDAERVLLLPEDPDATCAALRARLAEHFGARIGIVMNDSVGRAWRNGTVGIAIGASGLPALDDRIGEPDLHGRPLESTLIGFADEIAAAASLVMGQGDEATPAVIVRGLHWDEHTGGADALLRPKEQDLFR